MIFDLGLKGGLGMVMCNLWVFFDLGFVSK